MPIQKESKPQASEQETLKHISSLLHLFHHRNKNQHRRSIWWRHFSTFRRQLDRHIADLVSLDEVPTTHLARTMKKARDAKTAERVQQRLDFWRDVALPKWQRAFSQVAADGRFSVLGLVQMAALAEVCKVVGITAELEELGQVEVEKVLQTFGEELWGGEAEMMEVKEDYGKVIERDVTISTTTKPSIAASTPDVSEERPKKRALELSGKTAKKRKKANAIDDLFSGLG